MFRPVSMQRVTLKLVSDDAPTVAVVLAEYGLFSPTPSQLPEAILPEWPGEYYRKLFHSAKGRLDKLQRLVNYQPVAAVRGFRVVELAELERLNEELGALWARCSAFEERRHNLELERERIIKLRQSLEIFSSLDVDLSLLRGPHPFLNLQVGTLPLVDLQRFEKSLAMAPHHFMKVFHRRGELAYVMFAGPLEPDSELQKLLQTAEFHAIDIPPEFKDHPQNIQIELSAQIQLCDTQLAAFRRELTGLRTECSENLVQYDHALRYAATYAALAPTLRGGRGGLALVEGWVPAQDLAALGQRLQHSLHGRYQLSAREPTEQELKEVPTLLRNPPYLRGFEKLVENFGIPRYGEVDPTPLFAVSAILMFGMMFGDLGHGAVILLAAWLGRRVLGDFTPLAMAAGASSMGFGGLYGSLFGYEQVLPALWLHPIRHPMLMLSLAVLWGVGLILIACSLKVYNLLRNGEFRRAYFDTHGIAGILFYLGGLYTVYQLGQGHFDWNEAAYLLLPLGSVVAYKWHEQREVAVVERVIVVLIESFDFIMAFLSNTLSFMRVAAFSLNHAALAIAVFTLANGMQMFGHGLTVVLGNVFILVLEGAIVGIQVLRLEYYEGFVRFFSGDGRPFRPLLLNPQRGS